MSAIRSLLIFAAVFAGVTVYLFYLQPHHAPACDGDLETELARNLVTRKPGDINKRVDMPNIGISEIKTLPRQGDSPLMCQAVFTYDHELHSPVKYKVLSQLGYPPVTVEFVR